jgi:hypothetical protein
MQSFIFRYNVCREHKRVGIVAGFIKIIYLRQVVRGLVGQVHDALRDHGSLRPRCREVRGDAVFSARKPRGYYSNTDEGEENDNYLCLAGRFKHLCGALVLSKREEKGKDSGFCFVE